MRNLVVVGASLAGLRAVEAARKAGFDGRITLIGAEPHLPYDRPPLSKQFLLDTNPRDVTYRDRAVLEHDLRVELLLGMRASGIDVRAKQVLVADRRVPYDAAVLATGSSPKTLPGAKELVGVHTLRTVDDARSIRTALASGARVAVVGGGFIGSELAATARRRGLDVTIVEALPAPLMRAVGKDLGRALMELHHDHGTHLRCGVTVQAIEGNGRVERLALSDGSRLAADLVVVGIGTEPAVGWLADSGIPLDNGVRCDMALRTGVPNVFTAGDVAFWRNNLFGEQMRLEHWTSAAEQGSAAARNAVRQETTAYETVPYFWSDWYDSRIQLVGVSEADEVRIVHGTTSERKFVALYRRGPRLVGALGLNYPALVMKYRRLISNGSGWDDALAFATANQ